MDSIIDKNRCCGCTACYSICPTKAITMQVDNEGFLYPIVNSANCIDCGLCQKTCPVINQHFKTTQPKAYLCRVSDESILMDSTSGGLFTPIAEYVLKRNGVVIGVGFNNDWVVCHKEATTIEEIKEFRGSKYVQSYLGDTFSKVRQHLKEGKWVCFSGTPCQVSGLKQYLGKEYERLITVDVVCHGTPSPLLMQEYVTYMQKRYNAKISGINFRKKTYGYHSGTMEIKFCNGKTYHGSARVDYLLKPFFKGIALRPCCYSCAFKTVQHDSDFTIFDAWSAKKLRNDLNDDDKGYTNVLLHTDKSQRVMKEIESITKQYEINLQNAIKYDGVMIKHSSNRNHNRDKFYQLIIKSSLTKAIQKYIPITAKDKIIEVSKVWFYRLGLINVCRVLIKKGEKS